MTEQLENQNRENFEMLDSPLNEAQHPDAENQTTGESSNNTEHSRHTGHEHHHHQDLERRGKSNTQSLNADMCKHFCTV